MKPVSVALCCNTPGNGNFNGAFDAVDIGTDELLNLRADLWPTDGIPLEYHFKRVGGSGGFGCDRSEGFITVAGKSFQVHGYKQGWGNRCWDCVIMSPQTAIEFINHLKSLDVFTPEVAQIDFMETWEAPGALFDERHIPALEESGYAAP